MYNSKLAVAIKSKGKVLREFGEEVYLPFGEEYSIFIKNLNTVRALVTIEIDGEDVGDGTQFVVNPNESVDIERFISNGNLKKGNRFKFIERTDNVEKHRGIGVEDGLIRVEFAFEKKMQPYTTTTWTSYGTAGGCFGSSNATYTINNSVRGPGDGYASNGESVQLYNCAVSDVGITVPGSISDQKFDTVAWFPTEDTTHAIVLKLLGETPDKVQVRKPVTVKTKPSCVTCGRKNKATAKFCTECGTSLHIV